MSIALEAFGKEYLVWANKVGINPELLHRVASVASGGLDTMPHNGAVITLLGIVGLKHRDSYWDIAMVTLVIPFAVVFVGIFLQSIIGFI